MTYLIAGLVLWTLAHGIKIHFPAERAKLAGSVGDIALKGLIALVILGSVALMALGYQRADYIAVWSPPAWTVHLNNLLMVFAILVYTAGQIPGHVRAWIRHPQLTGMKIWAAAHLLVNGDLASIVLFGGLLAWAVTTMIGLNKRDGKGPKPKPGSWLADGAHLLLALVLVAAIGWVHNWFGYWPFAGTPPG